MDDGNPTSYKITGQAGGAIMDRLRDLPQSAGPVVDGVHAGDDSQQHLRGTDIRGRLLTADVLLSSLPCQAEAGSAITIFGNSDKPARQSPLHACADSNETRLRPPIE